MKKFPKLSQKERKKLASVPDAETVSVPAASPVETKPAWGGWARPALAVAEQVGGPVNTPSLTDIMQVEARSRSGDEAGRYKKNMFAYLFFEIRVRIYLVKIDPDQEES
jgi:hypothetical protein